MNQKDFTPKQPWTLEMFKARIVTIEKEIAECCQKMNKIDRQVNQLREDKKTLALRVSKKTKYKTLLQQHIMELIETIPDPQETGGRFNSDPNPDECDATVSK